MINNDDLNLLSTASHNVKNIASAMNSTYQLIERQHPEAASFQFWSQLGNSISDLIRFMNDTSIYRYSFSCDFKPVNIEDLLYSIPDRLDDIFINETRNYEFDIRLKNTTISADYDKLSYAIIELVKNAYEATNENDCITISATSNNEMITITVANRTNLECTVNSNCITPFYTTKSIHTGVGLSTAYNVALFHNGKLSINSDNQWTSVAITIPVTQK